MLYLKSFDLTEINSKSGSPLTMALSSTASQLSSKNTIGSLFLFILSVLSVVGAIGLGFSMNTDFGSFWAIAALFLATATLLCVTLPGAVLFGRTHNTRYRLSLRLSLLTLTLLLFEFVGAFFFSPGS
jgi:hypothetical protein